MACVRPMMAVRRPFKTASGKSDLRFLCSVDKFRARVSKGEVFPHGQYLLLPCRQCIECRLAKSREWACRLMHQKKFHAESMFLTLTYDQDHVPKDGSLNKTDFRTFFKDLRGRFDYYGLGKLKFFGVGEYGEEKGRPHYHAIVFTDCIQRTERFGISSAESSRSGDLQFSSGLISEVWPYGLHRFSEVTFESAAYVARYALKKVSGALKSSHYGSRSPEFQSCSNGIGKDWFKEFKEDAFPADSVIVRRNDRMVEMCPPEYYMRLLEKFDPAMFRRVKLAREESREQIDSAEWVQGIDDRVRIGEVRTLVAEATLKREGVL